MDFESTKADFLDRFPSLAECPDIDERIQAFIDNWRCIPVWNWSETQDESPPI